MLARHEQQIAEALISQRPRFAHHFVHRQRDPQDRVVAREAAVLAVVDALVREIERCEEADDLSEALSSERLRTMAERFKHLPGGWREQRGEV